MMVRPKQIRSDGQLSSLAGPRESSTLRPSDRLVTAAVRKQQERGDVQPGMEKQDVISAHGVPHDGDSDGSDTDSSLDDEHPEQSMKQELSKLSFEQLQELQNTVGLKLYNQLVDGGKRPGSCKEQKQCHRTSPMQMSSKRPVPYLRKVLPVNKKLRRDPRFDDLSGDFKAEIYDKTYSFLTELRNEEKTVIRKKLKKVKDPKQQEELRALLQRMSQQDKAQTKRAKQCEWLQEFRQKQRERVQQGKRPYFLKKSEQRRLELAEKYLTLKKTGKLERFVGRKRKRNAEKDRGRLPRSKSR